MAQLSHILRRFGRAPGFTAIALLTLAIGIGANTAVFSVVNGVLIQPLAYPEADRLVGVWHTAPGIAGIGDRLNASPTMYFTYLDENQTFEHVGVWSNLGADITGGGEPEHVQIVLVTYGALDALGVQPVLGRWFSREEDTAGKGEETVMLMYGLWQRRFGGDKNIIGQTIQVDSRPRRVIGVMPEDFKFLNQTEAELILPERFDRSKAFLGNFGYQGIARLKPGVTIERANADVRRMLDIWLKSWPAPPGFDKGLFENAHIGPKLQPLKEDVVGDIGKVLWVLMGTIGLVLLMACANVANLLLVRAEGRQQELAIRAALGAGWGRIARELLLESIVLGLLGGAIGLGLAYGALRVFVASGPATLPRLNEIGLDPLVLAFALGVSLLSGLLFGLIPVIKYTGPQIAGALRGGGRTLSQSRERHRARNTLVVVQVALALVLLVASGLMIRTFQKMRSIPPGFSDPAHVQLLRIAVPEGQVKEPERVVRLEQEMIDKLAAIPGVDAVAVGSNAPLEGINNNGDVLYAQDKDYKVDEIPPIRRFRFITPGYLKSTGIPLIAGRDYDWTDLYGMREVAMVSENLAREMWGSPAAALGKRIREGMQDPWREIVGVVGDVYDNGMNEEAPKWVYWPAMMGGFWGNQVLVNRFAVFVVRTARAGTESFLDEARQAIWSVSRNQPVYRVSTLADLYDQSMARTSFTLVMLAIAGGMALVLGVIGIYGVISYAVQQRTREIGIRMALGAQHADLRGMFVRYGLMLATTGVAIGAGAALGLSRLMQSLLFQVSPLDPLTYGAVAVVLVAAAVLASYLPARRAAGVDPVDALRAD